MDSLTPERRSWNMSRIRGKNTEPERVVRSLLHRLGFRFRLHRKELPGTPDIVLPARRIAVFIHGCYWHRHPGCRYAYTPKSRVEFWTGKFRENVERDTKAFGELARLGWKVLVVWECEIWNADELEKELLEVLGDKKNQ